MADSLCISGRLRRGDLDLRIALDLPGGVIAVVGPNGAGKPTMLRAIAGLERITSGEIVLGGDVLDRPLDATFVPAESRDVSMAFQQPRLFPHLSVLRNIAYPLERSGVARRRALEQAEAVAARVGVHELADLRPRELSGGQAQRVGIGRALIAGASTLLLDEPLGAIDESSRHDLRALFENCDAERVVGVTHDPTDADRADLVVSAADGRIEQTAS